MTESILLNAGFTDVDRSGSAASFVSHLDRLAPSEWVQATKMRSFMLLEIRAGSSILDVGCGTGDDVRALGKLVGPTGRVVGVDKSQTMVDESQRRAAAQDSMVEFRLIDGNRLDFPDASFDGCRMDRVLHHLDDPAGAFAELVRVARPGGRLVIHEPDFEMLAIDSPNRTVTRKVLNFFCDSHANGWAGRQLYGFARRARLVDVRIEASTWVSTDYAEIRLRMRLEQTIEQAIAAGVLATAEAGDWLAGLRAEDDAGQFYWASTVFLLSGRKR